MSPDAGAARARVAAAAMPLALPLLTYYVWFCLTFRDGALTIPSSAAELGGFLRGVPLPTAMSVSLYLAWLSLQVLLHAVAPGPVREGPILADGSRLRYRLNGWFSFWATWLVVAVAVWATDVPASIAYDEFGPLLTTATIVAFALAAYLHARGRGGGVRTFVMGRELNPRIGTFDFKFFCESRPGLMLWVVINASLAAKQYELYGEVTTPMLLVNAFQFLYVADYFFYEEAILSTWDIKHERFGWMLCWGCLVWVPFTFSIQAYFLVTHAHELPAWAAYMQGELDARGLYSGSWR